MSVKMIIVGTGSNVVPPVPEEQAADNQPPASEASSSPMDVDSPTAGFCTFLIIVFAKIT